MNKNLNIYFIQNILLMKIYQIKNLINDNEIRFENFFY